MISKTSIGYTLSMDLIEDMEDNNGNEYQRENLENWILNTFGIGYESTYYNSKYKIELFTSEGDGISIDIINKISNWCKNNNIRNFKYYAEKIILRF